MPPDSASMKTSLRRAFGLGVWLQSGELDTRICGQALSDNMVACSTQGLWASRKDSPLLQTACELNRRDVSPKSPIIPERTHVILSARTSHPWRVS